MSWLIEAYFEEGKQAPDHPKSLNMKDKKDFYNKQVMDALDITHPYIQSHSRDIHKSVDELHANNHFGLIKGHDKEATKKAAETFDKLRPAHGKNKDPKHPAIGSEEERTLAIDAIERKNRKLKQQGKKVIGESVDMLVEILQ